MDLKIKMIIIENDYNAAHAVPPLKHCKTIPLYILVLEIVFEYI
jgi:hypothetical protein